MDAFVRHKCDKEILAIIEETAKELGITKQIKIESLPLKKGSLAEWIQSTTYANITATLSLFISVLTLIYSRIPTKPYKSEVDKTQQILDHESKKLDIENKRLEAEKRKLELIILKNKLSQIDEKSSQLNIDEINTQVSLLQDSFHEILSQNILIKKHLSNLYQHLLDYKKVIRVSYTHYDINMNIINSIQKVERQQFQYFVIDPDEFSDYDENARIHIYAPSLVKGKHKWKGFYEQEHIVIDFNMRDSEFKKEVEEGLIDFRNGSMIDAVLHKRIKFDESGNETSRTYSVTTVLQKFDGSVFEETKQGKKFKAEKKFLENQILLNFDNNSDKL